MRVCPYASTSVTCARMCMLHFHSAAALDVIFFFFFFHPTCRIMHETCRKTRWASNASRSARYHRRRSRFLPRRPPSPAPHPPPPSLSPPGWPEVVRPRLGRRREAADQTASCLTAGDEETVSRISEQSVRSPLQSHVSGSPSARCHQRWLNSHDDCEVMEQHALLL